MEEIEIRLLRTDDIQQINDLYFKSYKVKRSNEKFSWEFLNCPAGPAIYVVAVDTKMNKVVGTQCAIPLFVSDSSRARILTAKSEDTLVDADYRGKNIFERMYALLFEECRKAGIVSLWGFTYAVKPFKKIGFDIPFSCDFGLIALNGRGAYRYFDGLKPKRSFVEKLKIAGMSVVSRMKYILHSKSSLKGYSVSTEVQQSLESVVPSNGFHLVLDSNFFNWRLRTNPYPNNHLYYALSDSSGKLAGSVICSQSAEVSYIMNMAFDHDLSRRTKESFLDHVINDISTKTSVLRFWGFTHNNIGRDEIELLKSSGFIFTGQGISFVWKKLDEISPLDVNNFVLSRMASQGT